MSFPVHRIPTSPNAYIAWGETAQIVAGTYNNTYMATFGAGASPPLPGLADLLVNGSEDVLDRQKMAVNPDGRVDLGLGCLLGLDVSCSFTEEGAISDSWCTVLWSFIDS